FRHGRMTMPGAAARTLYDLPRLGPAKSIELHGLPRPVLLCGPPLTRQVAPLFHGKLRSSTLLARLIATDVAPRASVLNGCARTAPTRTTETTATRAAQCWGIRQSPFLSASQPVSRCSDAPPARSS